MRIERELESNLKEKVILYLDGPIKSSRKSEFFCKIGLLGDKVKKEEIIYGIDQFQALILAMRHLNNFVLRASQSISPSYLTWELGDGRDDFGLNLS